MIIADSDVLIDALRGRKNATNRIKAELTTSGLGTTTISRFELLSGAKTETETLKVEKLLNAMTIIPFDDSAAIEAARIRRAGAAEPG